MQLSNKYIQYILLLFILWLGSSYGYAQLITTAGETTELSVEAVSGEVYTWELYNVAQGVDFAVEAGNCDTSQAFFVQGNTGSAVEVTWVKPGTYFYKVTAENSCTNNIKVGKVVVNFPLPTVTLDVLPDSICAGDGATLLLNFSGHKPYSIILKADDGEHEPTLSTYSNINSDEFAIEVFPERKTTYSVITLTDSHGTNLNPEAHVVLTVKPLPVNSRIYRYE